MLSRKPPLVLALLGLLTLLLGCRGDPTTVLTRLEESRKLVATLRLDFHLASDATNRAVMADTEGASVAAAQESKTATSAVEKNAAKLAQLLDGLSYADEARILREFRAGFSEYMKLDERIVTLAVENTNLKAQALSFGPASEAADAFAEALSTARSHFLPKDLERVDLLTGHAMLAVREIQVLHAPHIAEREEAAMARMEKRMADLYASATAALLSVEALAQTEARPALANARSALSRFEAASQEIVALSRRNSNVLSLELALRQKPALVAACQERLSALQDALAQEGPKSTR